jgi:hypothetical protein
MRSNDSSALKDRAHHSMREVKLVKPSSAASLAIVFSAGRDIVGDTCNGLPRFAASRQMIPSTYALACAFNVLTSFYRPRTLLPIMRRLVRCFARRITFASVVVICADVACSDQILPQLLAHIASLDPDHHVAVRAGSLGVDLLLAHESSSGTATQQTASVIISTSSEPAHVIHFCSRTTNVNQSAIPLSGTKRQVAGYLAATVSLHFDVFVPKVVFVDSRLPPERTANPFNRSTSLLI